MRYAWLPILLLSAALPVQAGTWRQAYVVDTRLSVLRARPSLTAPVLKRLRSARMVAIVERRRDAEGREWARVAVTRRTRGWLLVDAIAWPGDAHSERRLAARLDATRGLARLQVARLALGRFPALRPRALAAIEVEATIAASKLSRAAARRLGALEGEPPGRVRALMLSDPGLDPFTRLGVLFDVDVANRRYLPRTPE